MLFDFQAIVCDYMWRYHLYITVFLQLQCQVSGIRLQKVISKFDLFELYVIQLTLPYIFSQLHAYSWVSR